MKTKVAVNYALSDFDLKVHIWMKIRDFWGKVTPLGGVPSTLGEGKNLEKGDCRGAEGAANFFDHFLEIFGKFVNNNAIESGFGVILIEIPRELRKNAHFSKFSRYFYQDHLKILLLRCRDPPPKNSP